jgi:hypothetical protein
MGVPVSAAARRSTDGHRQPYTGTCPDCGKVRYLTRADAKQALKRQSRRNRIYRCGDFWHTASWQPQDRILAYREAGQ